MPVPAVPPADCERDPVRTTRKGERRDPLWTLLGVLFKAHPWHGVPLGPDPPRRINAYIEIVPTDTVKYELDKESGHLWLDRPQRFSNVCPALYGLIPQTFCGERVARACEDRVGEQGLVGDSDPLDVCVFTEKTIHHGNIFLHARPIGGLRMIDDGEADDKVLAVLEGDSAYGGWRDVADCPRGLIDRLEHYFLTYKDAPGAGRRNCRIAEVYGREEAWDVIRRSHEDYRVRMSGLEDLLSEALRG
jgi:inorganic pyrophosphatase